MDLSITVAGTPLVGYLLAATRLLTWLLLVPPFATRSIPAQVKFLLALGLAFAVVPTVPDAEVPRTAVTLVSLMAQETLIGASLGFVTFLVLAAIQAAGDLIDVFGGFSTAAAYDPLSFQMNSVFGRLYQMLASALLFTSGAHLVVLYGLLRTFERLPVGELIDLADLGRVVPAAFATFLICAVQIALPLIGVLFVADLGLALMTKVAPHLNAIGIMFPAKIGLTLIVVAMSVTVLPDAVTRLVEHAVKAMGALTTGGVG